MKRFSGLSAAVVRAAWVLVLVSAILPAQTTHGSITGFVLDPSGAVIPGVNVTVAHEQTGLTITVQSQSNGSFQALQLSPGNYSVSAQAAGFKKLTVGHLKVDVGTALTQDLALEVGLVTETMQVLSQASRVETTSGSVGTTVSVNHVLDMPLQDRNVYNLVNLVPGAFSLSYGESPVNAQFINISLGGSRTLQTSATVDGVSGSRGGVGFNNVDLSPPVDAMQEFKVEINSMSAEYGRTMGGVVNAVTKSGTNRYHGSLYEFLRNDKLDASGWGAPAKPPLRRNIFGGTIGGPIRKNSTFFFYNYDGLRNRQPSVVFRSLGLPEWRTGNLSNATRDAGGRAAVVPVYDPTTGTGTFGAPRGTLQFPGNIIPVSRLDPVAVKALSYWPVGNHAPSNPYSNADNFQMNSVSTLTRDYHTIRIDHELTSGTKMYFRYIFTRPDDSETPPLPGFGPSDVSNGKGINRRQNYALNVSHLFTPTFFLNATAGFNRWYGESIQGASLSTNWGQTLGIPNAGPPFPRLQFGSGLIPMTNIGNGGQSRNATNTTNFIVNMTKIRNSHTFKFGIELDRFNGNNFNDGSQGIWTFDGTYTRGIDANGAAVANTGFGFGDFLLGRLNGISASIRPGQGLRSQAYAGYFQDDWKVTRNMTLNLGVRYDTVTPVYGVNDRFSNFDPYTVNPLAGTNGIPAGALGVFTFQNRNGWDKYLYNWNKLGFAPRFGFAYRIRGSSATVLRGGYGIFYGTSTPGGVGSNAPPGFTQQYIVGNPVPTTLREGLPPNALDPLPVSVFTPTWGSRGTQYVQSAAGYMDPQLPYPYNQNLNLNLQHQWMGMLLEVGYLGNLGRHVPSPATNLNQIPPALLSQTSIPENLRRPFTTLGGNQANVGPQYSGWGITSYHAMTVKLDRRYSNGFSWIVAYTWSKWIDNVKSTSTTGATLTDNNNPQTLYDRKLERSLATNDIPHRLVVSPIVDLPFGKSRHWLNRGGALNAVLGGWQVSTIGTMQSGSPFGTLVLNGARDILGDATSQATLRPDQIGDPNHPLQGQPSGGVRGIYWVNPAAFAVPARYTYGTAARTTSGILKPGLINFDTMMAKNFTFHEKFRLQFRWEMFNFTNTPYWGLPNENFTAGASNFGIITSAGSRRLMQMGLKLYW